MRKNIFIRRGPVVLIAMLIVLFLFPMAASATITTGVLLSGSVTLNGQYLTLQDNATVSAFIPGVDVEWSKEVEIFWGQSRYVQILIPMNSGSGLKNGGEKGDAIYFKVVINGSTYVDPTTVTWLQAEQIWHNINLTTADVSELMIVTPSLASGEVGTDYNQTMAAKGGMPSYEWSWSAANGLGLPAGLTLSTGGLISGKPTAAGTFAVTIMVEDAFNVTATKNFNLTISSNATLIITTIRLPGWATETWPADPPDDWLKPPPGWIITSAEHPTPYAANLTATGGVGSLHWNASNLPPGLSLSEDGEISGAPTAAGLYDIVFTVKDSANPQNSASKTVTLKIYLVGDANGNGEVSIGDVAYTDSAILGLVPPTAGCDADLDGQIDVADMTEISKIILFTT